MKLPSAGQRTVALCYIRQSFTRDANDTNSPERQRANIQKVCDREGWSPEWFVDAEGHRSGRYENNRPEWLRLKDRLSDPSVVALVANDMSRLHRKAWRVGRLVDEVLKSNGVRLVLAAPGREIDTSTPMGQMLLMMIAMQDESYANDIAQRTRNSIAYRKSKGKSIGMPPYGTVRDDEGYLIPIQTGAWLLPDGTFVAGEHAEEAPPVEGAVWRGYYDCARRMLELYAENKHGRSRIAYQMDEEGWAFRDRWQRPRPINKHDVRRVTSNWLEYAGVVIDENGSAKDRNPNMMNAPIDRLKDTGHAVFELELLRRVAIVQQKRRGTARPRGSARKVHTYALSQLLVCASCKDLAEKHDNPKLQTHLVGHNLRGTLRYRHHEGVQCGCKTRSVLIEKIEDEFRLLLTQLTVNPKEFDLMMELAVQSKNGQRWQENEADIEKQRHEAIAKCRRRIEAAKSVFLDGDMSREEYVKVKENNEREIVHWQTRTTDTQKAAIEFQMCINAINEMVGLWDAKNDQDRQDMAHMLFEYVVYDLDKKRIVDFRLKSWADRYLILRCELFGGDDDPDGGDDPNEKRPETCSDLKVCNVIYPIGESNSCFRRERATSWATRRMGQHVMRKVYK